MKRLFITCIAGLSVAFAQAQFSVSGQVTDHQGEPLPGANVYLENTQFATATDGSGNFKIGNITPGDYRLQASFVGYQTFSTRVEINKNLEVDITLEEDILHGEDVIVYATRAHEKTPTTFSNISNEEIEEQNMGQDLPFVLRYTPSVVVTSDAGNGVGYTGITIRGSDQTRINVTVNGIPLNDAESHGTFWVNMPDFTSSVNNIQIQRGVGTSTNGAAAFGASINLQTEMPAQEPFGKIVNGYGSFNTWRHTVEYNTGLIDDRWSFQGRLSKISSDGYIDRASADLKSYYLAGGYYGEKTSIKALTFAGNEVTYQSWNGTPEARLENDEEGMMEVIANNGYTEEQAANLLNSGRTFNHYLYENEVDHYQQDHYQLHFNHTFSSKLNVSAALHYTYGRGYYEQYRNDDDFSDYNLPNLTFLRDSLYSNGVDADGNFINSNFGSDLQNEDIERVFRALTDANGDTIRNVDNDVLLDATAEISSTDLIRRRWLDNHFYGTTFSINYTETNYNLTLGGAYNRYEGDHFGEIIWAKYASTSAIRDRYYDNVGEKEDFNLYIKGNFQVSDRINLFADAQVRTIDYHTIGIDNDLRQIDAGDDYVFFNPKAGFTYTLGQNENLYASFAISNREPVRGDFIDAPAGVVPKHETLRNLEVGYRKSASGYMLSANYYLMDYVNQLVLTGAVNDVGSSIRTNVPDSYRTGVELVGAVEIFKGLNLGANVTLSQNKIKNFFEVLYDYGPDFDEYHTIETVHSDTDIAFSPNVIAGGQLSYSLLGKLEIALFSKYVGKQYLDNTSNEDRAINAYFVNDLKLDYNFDITILKEATLSLMVNNIFNHQYVSNGYTFGYLGGDYTVRENYYYPQAGINFLASLTLKF